MKMSKIINGTEYKIVYLDTNALSEMAKNYKGTATNILQHFGFMSNDAKTKYAFATSVFNLDELSKSTKYRSDIIKMFNTIPLFIIAVFPEIIDTEANNEAFVSPS